MTDFAPLLLSGNEAVALAAHGLGVSLGVGYPGTPSSEILAQFAEHGGRAEWSPNEKVALEVGLGVAFAGARALVTMKHVGLNVAADPLFTAAYTGVSGALVIVSADDPGMASSQNEQDNRHYARFAGLPMLEPSDSQDAYDFMAAAVELSEQWKLPVLLRMTTRVCHSTTIVQPRRLDAPATKPTFKRDIPGRVMIPAYARPAHRRLREKLEAIAAWNEEKGPIIEFANDSQNDLGIVASGVAYWHAREAAPNARFLKLGCTWPLPIERVRSFAENVRRCFVVEEGDPFLAENLLAAGICVETAPACFRFGELNASRVRRLLAGDKTEQEQKHCGKPPQLCPGCPHRIVFEALRDFDCIVAGDIGCYTLGVLPPFQAMDTCVCMGASIGVGLGLRHALPPAQARRVVSVIGDSTFMHSGLTGLIEMVYNPPTTGHVILLLDNSTTAMTGLQDHPGTGRHLNRSAATLVSPEAIARAAGVQRVKIIDPVPDPDAFRSLLKDALASDQTVLLVARRPCLLAAARNRKEESAASGAAK